MVSEIPLFHLDYMLIQLQYTLYTTNQQFNLQVNGNYHWAREVEKFILFLLLWILVTEGHTSHSQYKVLDI